MSDDEDEREDDEWEDGQDDDDLVEEGSNWEDGDEEEDEYGDDWGNPDNWSLHFDDLGPSYWESLLHGPDEDDSDDPEDGAYMIDDEEEDGWEEEGSREDEGSPDDRRAAVVRWLSNSGASRPVSGDVFAVSPGPGIRFLDGSVLDVVDWCRAEGVRAGIRIGDYTIADASEVEHGFTGLVFSRVVFDAPFSPPADDAGAVSEEPPFADPGETTDDDCDLPF